MERTLNNHRKRTIPPNLIMFFKYTGTKEIVQDDITAAQTNFIPITATDVNVPITELGYCIIESNKDLEDSFQFSQIVENVMPKSILHVPFSITRFTPEYEVSSHIIGFRSEFGTIMLYVGTTPIKTVYFVIQYRLCAVSVVFSFDTYETSIFSYVIHTSLTLPVQPMVLYSCL